MKKFLISVVVPIYNTEKYLRETIDSVINQSIGFEKNIQLILVNNDTRDNSEKICFEYKRRYPENVEYVCVEENRGPCSARNAGQKVAVGKYINFLDSDDKWKEDAFEHAITFFEEHYDEIDIVSCRIQHFDAFTDYDLFDFKYEKGTRIVDLEKEPKYVLFSLCSSIIKRETAILFWHDERIRHAEDMKYLTEIMFRTFRYGLVKESKFYYRSRLEQNSTLDTTASSDNWYKETVKYAYLYLLDLSVEKLGYVCPYLQHILLSEVRGRLEKDIPNKYDIEFIHDYKKSLSKILEYIDDKFIIEESHLTIERKIYALKLKWGGKRFYSWLKRTDESLIFKEWELFKLNELVKFRTVTVIEDRIIITGFYRSGISVDIEKIEACDENGVCKIEIKPLDRRNMLRCLNEDVCQGKAFYLSLPFELGKHIKFYLYCNDIRILQKITFLEMHSCNEVSFCIENNAITVVGENKNLYPTYYLFPFESVERNATIYLYGAGYIGRQYIDQIQLSNYCKILGVADQNYENIKSFNGIEVIDPQIMVQKKFDKVVIAMGKRECVAKVIENLVNSGIQRSKIVIATERSIPWY